MDSLLYCAFGCAILNTCDNLMCLNWMNTVELLSQIDICDKHTNDMRHAKQ